ncbi:MAG: GTP 3',8-cyclase [Candidatus Hydrogenedentota bacterium]
MPETTYHESYHFLQKSELLTFEEICVLARSFVKLGVRKVRITGGEPLLRRDLDQLVLQLAGIELLEDIALTTNGVLLPSYAQSLMRAGLRRITLSLDTLDDAVFGAMNGGRSGVDAVLQGLRAAEAAGFPPAKINAVVIRGLNEHTVVELVRRFKGTGHIVRFIEYMDVGTCNGWGMHQVVPSREICAMINAVFPIAPVEPNYRGEVAARYRFLDGSGEIGFISSVSAPFCGDCTRMRLSAEGKLYTCLFASDGFDLRTPLRDGAHEEEITALIASLWQQRADRYSEVRMETLNSPEMRKHVEMYHIGG